MLAGFYTAASGMLMNQRALDVTANNMANVKTPGFRAERVTSTIFEQTLLARQEAAYGGGIGRGAPIRLVEDVMTAFDPSMVIESDRPFDMAIIGEGFFNIEGENQQFLTRNGNFDMDEEGYLVLRGVGRVLGEDGPIVLEDANFIVSSDGVLYDSRNREIGTLLLTMPARPNELEKFSNGLYINPNAEEDVPTGNIGVAQRMLEQSNIDLNREMTLSMDLNRSFQSCSNILKGIDLLNQKTVGEIGKL